MKGNRREIQTDRKIDRDTDSQSVIRAGIDTETDKQRQR